MSNTQTFWKRLDQTTAGMLGIVGDRRLVPMSHYPDKETNSLWFITANGTDLVSDVTSAPKGAEFLIANGGDGLYATIHGELSLSQDDNKLDEIWNAVASSWFEDGKRDDDVRLLQMRLSDAEVWATNPSSLVFLYQVAKANATGEKPDIGEHFRLSF